MTRVRRQFKVSVGWLNHLANGSPARGTLVVPDINHERSTLENERLSTMLWCARDRKCAGLDGEIILHEKIVSSMYFSDADGNKVEPEHYGIEHEAIEGAYDVTLFEDFGNGQTKLTYIGNETMEEATKSGQLEGWNQILDKVDAVLAQLALAK